MLIKETQEKGIVAKKVSKPFRENDAHIILIIL